uniref:Uncharacterized protein n=1 Tax=Nelumbo nucifera TaxID=4432 RepID=A0A822ZRU7_NELNU|nr:TPA_asm: hypothetical protein HUJ06_018591 [Nelumbo nucifera]
MAPMKILKMKTDVPICKCLNTFGEGYQQHNTAELNTQSESHPQLGPNTQGQMDLLHALENGTLARAGAGHASSSKPRVPQVEHVQNLAEGILAVPTSEASFRHVSGGGHFLTISRNLADSGSTI